MNGSTTKVFASWKRIMTLETYNLMLKRSSLRLLRAGSGLSYKAFIQCHCRTPQTRQTRYETTNPPAIINTLKGCDGEHVLQPATARVGAGVMPPECILPTGVENGVSMAGQRSNHRHHPSYPVFLSRWTRWPWWLKCIHGDRRDRRTLRRRAGGWRQCESGLAVCPLGTLYVGFADEL